MVPPQASTSSAKLSVPQFLKYLVSNVGLTTAQAMGATSALVKAGYNRADVPNPFAGTSEPALVACGVLDPDVRKTLVAWGRTSKQRTFVTDAGGQTHKKRKSRESDLDKPLPIKAEDKPAISLEFEEVMEDYLLHDRSLVINRAPVMTAWATVVAERLGFTRQEALSIAHTYTNMNATAKGVSLGIYSPEKGKQRTEVAPSQPYVDLLGRKIPMLALQTGEWRGIANGAIAEPEQAFGYIQRSFRQHMSAAMGAFKLLAETIEPDELNKVGFNLYADFRPDVRGWGERGQLHLGKVLDLRRNAEGVVAAQKTKPGEDEDLKTMGNGENATGHVVSNLELSGAASAEQSNAAEAAGHLTGQSQTVKQEEVETEERPAADEISSPPLKKVKREVEVGDEFDDGGIDDSDLAGLS